MLAYQAVQPGHSAHATPSEGPALIGIAFAIAIATALLLALGTMAGGDLLPGDVAAEGEWVPPVAGTF